METIQMRILQELEKNESIPLTAEGLGLSVGGVRNHLASLEQEWGYPLFLRERNKCSLTKNGLLVLKYAENILRMRLDLIHRFQDIDSLDNTVICSMESTLPFLAPAVMDFQREVPQVKLKILNMSSRFREKETEEMLSDFIIFISPGKTEPEGTVTLLSSEFRLALSADHPAAKAGAVDLRDLRDEIFLLPPAGSALRQVIDGYFRQAGYLPKTALEIADNILEKQLAAAGMGAVFLYPVVIQRDLDEPIVRMPISFPDCSFHVSLRSRWTDALPSAARLFRQYLLRYFGVEDTENRPAGKRRAP